MTVALVQVVVMKVLRSCPMLDLAGYAYRKGVQYECEKKNKSKIVHGLGSECLEGQSRHLLQRKRLSWGNTRSVSLGLRH